MTDDDEDYQYEEDYSYKGDGVCPVCGAPTINCVVADNACTNCDYAEQVYTGTIYG